LLVIVTTVMRYRAACDYINSLLPQQTNDRQTT